MQIAHHDGSHGTTYSISSEEDSDCGKNEDCLSVILPQPEPLQLMLRFSKPWDNAVDIEMARTVSPHHVHAKAGL